MINIVFSVFLSSQSVLSHLNNIIYMDHPRECPGNIRGALPPRIIFRPPKVFGGIKFIVTKLHVSTPMVGHRHFCWWTCQSYNILPSNLWGNFQSVLGMWCRIHKSINKSEGCQPFECRCYFSTMGNPIPFEMLLLLNIPGNLWGNFQSVLGMW